MSPLCNNCNNCNNRLGWFRDDPDMLRRALDYLIG